VVVINPTTSTAAQVSSALSSAQQDGRLAAALAAVGVQMTTVDVLNAVPSGSKGAVAAAVGGAVGGAAVVAAAVAIFLMVRTRRARSRHADRLPVSTFSAHDEPPISSKHKVRVECRW